MTAPTSFARPPAGQATTMLSSDTWTGIIVVSANSAPTPLTSAIDSSTVSSFPGSVSSSQAATAMTSPSPGSSRRESIFSISCLLVGRKPRQPMLPGA